MSMASRLCVLGLAMLLMAPVQALAAAAPFDLAGPKLKIEVTRAGRTLPIGQVPNLSTGDQLRIKADLPAAQSAHYLLVAAFLRGATNPPPEKWFSSSETWKRKQSDGLKVVVPEGAQQLIVFLAPETSGDLKAIVNAVRGRPGAFVRASQDLNQASLDRSRLDAYLAAIRKVDQAEPERLKAVSPLLARSLTIKLDGDCLLKTPEARAPCLMQDRDSLVLDDGHSTSMVQALTSGRSADLVQQLSATPRAGSGSYSPYVASILDIAHLMDAFRTAQYQYFPALVTVEGDQLSLLLNAPPSFQNPKSVLLVALPAIEPAQPPPLHPVYPGAVDCLERPDLILQAEGAPLVFSGGYAHGMALRLKRKDGQVVDLPVKADPAKGGFAVETGGLTPDAFDGTVDGVLHGFWGFEPFEGPTFRLQSAASQAWRLAGDDRQTLIAGRDGKVRLEAPGAACVESVMLQGQADKLEWKATEPNQITVDVPLKGAKPGAVTLLVKTYAAKAPDAVPLQAFAQLGPFDGFAYHAHDASGVLKGGRLDEVAGLSVGEVEFKPAGMTPAGDGLTLTAADLQAAGKLNAGAALPAKVRLKDGRTVSLDVRIGSPRPSVALIGKSVQAPASAGPGAIQLADPNELPSGARLTFSVRAQAPATFSGKEAIEVATVRGAFSTTLTTAAGLTLQDSQVALATLDTGKAFNASAAGPLQFRMLVDGAAGDWQPLATLVRLPVLRDLQCPAEPDQPCQLTGSNLFLIDALAGDPKFDKAVQVPSGFPGDTLSVPRPTTGKLYVKLHDDPAVVSAATFPVQASTAPPPPAS